MVYNHTLCFKTKIWSPVSCRRPAWLCLQLHVGWWRAFEDGIGAHPILHRPPSSSGDAPSNYSWKWGGRVARLLWGLRGDELSLSKLMVQGEAVAPKGQQRSPRWTTLTPPPARHQGIREVVANLSERADGGGSGVIYGELTARDTISRGHTLLAAKAWSRQPCWVPGGSRSKFHLGKKRSEKEKMQKICCNKLWKIFILFCFIEHDLATWLRKTVGGMSNDQPPGGVFLSRKL